MLFVVPDLATLGINTVHPEAGAWPPADGTLLIERSALPLTHRADRRRDRDRAAAWRPPRRPIAGTVHDPGVAPAGQEQTVYGYVTPRTLAALGRAVPLTLLKVVVARDGGDAGRDRAHHARPRGLARHARQRGRTDPHPAAGTPSAPGADERDPGDAYGLQRARTACWARCCAPPSSARWLAQQVRQIAIMKAIGARTHQVALPTLALVALLGLLATAIGLPLGAAAAQRRSFARSRNCSTCAWQDATPPRELLVLLALPGLALPVLAALWPVLASARRSVRAALDDHGAGSETSAVARWAARP